MEKSRSLFHQKVPCSRNIAALEILKISDVQNWNYWCDRVQQYYKSIVNIESRITKIVQKFWRETVNVQKKAHYIIQCVRITLSATSISKRVLFRSIQITLLLRTPVLTKKLRVRWFILCCVGMGMTTVLLNTSWWTQCSFIDRLIFSDLMGSPWIKVLNFTWTNSRRQWDWIIQMMWL